MKTLLKIGLATISIIAAFKLVKGAGYNLGAEMMYKYKKIQILFLKKIDIGVKLYLMY